ncbi:DUF4234 domain-containing protein [Haloarchaeobius amylolyticus]|uniref:DUF4234 domain-containing protein n=1 Tax=Haloarchaeobius amylolyticus TaxID=1198296 RepID=UPI002271752B|nr:DUF4234 domain-containing protein [Haloarchaeobius amylolyticus]
MSHDTAALSKRSPPKILLFTIVTLGLYWLYYVHSLNTSFKQYLDAGYNPLVRTLMFLVPFVNLYAAWQVGQTATEVTDDLSTGLTAIGVLVPILGAFVIQPPINDLVDGE